MKNLYLLALSCMLFTSISSQTLLFGGSIGNGNFENGTNDWIFVNGTQANKWIVGANATTGFTGNGSVYISSNGNNHQYTTNVTNYSYFYKDVAIPAGSKTLWLVYDFISNGESFTDAFGTAAIDALRIWARPTTETITAGLELDNVFVDASFGHYNQTSWKKKHVRQIGVGSFAGSSIRLIFQWFNNGAGGNQPPAALDNIEFYSSCQEFIAPYADFALTGTSARIVWSTVPGATGYHLRYKKIDEPNSVPTYTNPVTVAGGATFNHTISNLIPSTDYIAEVSPIGTSCGEWASPAFFTTLEAPANDDCSNATLLPVWSSLNPATAATFKGATPTPGLASICANGGNNDVWFKFVANKTKQIIQTNDTTYNSSFFSAKNITLFTGGCNNLQAVSQPCATDGLNYYQAGTVTKLVAEGLTVGTTYYIRVNTNNNTGYDAFGISVYDSLPAPECPTFLQPVHDTVLNYGIPYTFKWTRAANNHGYRLRIFQESGAYTEVHTRDTFYVYTPVSGENYTWFAQPYNVLNQGAGCTAATFSTCPAAANTITLSAPVGLEKCGLDTLIIVASSGSNIQWFRYNIAIAGATNDTLWVTQPGEYTVRIKDGNCYSDPSNVISISNLPTPVKPVVTAGGATTFCDGGSVTLTSSFALNNQWFNGTTPIATANGISYSASAAGSYYVRVTNTGSGCSNFSDPVVVSVTTTPAKPVISSATTIVCSGDSLKLSSSMQHGNQWYKNNTLIAGATDSVYHAKEAGDYTVKIVSGTCVSPMSDIRAITLTTVPAAPVATRSGTGNFCVGDSVALTSSFDNGNQWYKDGNAIGNATSAMLQAKDAGQYTVKVTAAGCTSQASNAIVLTQFAVPAKPAVTVAGFTLSTPAGQAAYQWYFNNTLIAGATATQHTVLTVGKYKVQTTDANGCKSMSDEVNAVVTGVNDVEMSGYKISLFPNPVTEYININVLQGSSIAKTFTVTIRDLPGKTIRSQQLRTGINKITMNGLPQGHYFISIRNGNTIRTIKVLKGK